ncbi:MAG: GPP34 family phosphoprotein [Acidimicrobiaceae bacterium]|nr:GPP34 family phosphoprotein [Acidimicrobiaceae bacterium]MCY3644349.1 GPP34 family phosphoprotein [Acidimicrobiaceae bacterium]MDE0494732.1 GPP34 family phosphoprotein [Acidimicrobiaceae bacterium]MDE0665476.1 GPP34 family phosphoprotein [Acidimicrobiaceae bacterium]MYE56836.1 GPP34 family phosphoprotein [Acidimicrobiaceae bacterium]
MLRFAEEIILLMLHDDNGKFAPVPSWSLDRALAGAVLMDLALENRIDTDPENLILIDDTPVGDSLLDSTLAEISAGEQRDARYWVEHTAKKGEQIREEALSRLVDAGILERQEDRFLWVFRSRRYPLVDGKAEREVKLRIMEVLLSDQIPEPRDVVIIALADACGIFHELLPKRELQRASSRIEQVRKLDLIGQAMAQTIHDMQMWLAASRIEGRMF